MEDTKIREHVEGAWKDAIRGCLIGGAAGDALGYAVEFMREGEIFARYGKGGICSYEVDGMSGKALISDDTQMTLFTANDALYGLTRGYERGIGGAPHIYMGRFYGEWYLTQTESFRAIGLRRHRGDRFASWLMDVPELFHRRAPGTTCMTALESVMNGIEVSNNSKGCGGVMRVAPLGLIFPMIEPGWVAGEGEALAKITHCHPLGYMPAAMLADLISRITFRRGGRALREIVVESLEATKRLYAGKAHIDALADIVERAVEYAGNDLDDLENIHALGEGWVAEETLAIAIYCALRYADDFSACLIASVNHNGDSDSTGAVAGNILGAYLGFDAIEDKWKEKLELYDVLIEMADDMSLACDMQMGEWQTDAAWTWKYEEGRRRPQR